MSSHCQGWNKGIYESNNSLSSIVNNNNNLKKTLDNASGVGDSCSSNSSSVVNHISKVSKNIDISESSSATSTFHSSGATCALHQGEDSHMNHNMEISNATQRLNNIHLNNGGGQRKGPIKNQTTKDPQVEYPDDLNPFGDDEEEGSGTLKNKQSGTSAKNPEYPDELNPFDEEEDGDNSLNNSSNVNDYDNSLNPFGDEDEEEEAGKDSTLKADQAAHKPPVEVTIAPTPAPRKSLNNPPPRPPPPKELNTNLSPTPSVRSSKSNASPCRLSTGSSLASKLSPRRKLLPAPPPPPTPPTSHATADTSLNSLSSTASVGHDTPVAPGTPESARSSASGNVDPETSRRSSLTNSDMRSPSPNRSYTPDEISDSGSGRDSGSVRAPPRRKKRPAPGIPQPIRREVKGSVKEIEDELNIIGDKLVKLEASFNDVENRIKQSPTRLKIENEMVKEFLDIIRERCAVAKRQTELMYLKREHKLEEMHADIEYQMRALLMKPAWKKTEEDNKAEQDLLLRLKEVIDERNDIVENILREERINRQHDECRRALLRLTDYVDLEGSPYAPSTMATQPKEEKRKGRFKLREKKDKKDKEKKKEKEKKEKSSHHISVKSISKTIKKGIGVSKSKHKQSSTSASSLPDVEKVDNPAVLEATEPGKQQCAQDTSIQILTVIDSPASSKASCRAEDSKIDEADVEIEIEESSSESSEDEDDQSEHKPENEHEEEPEQEGEVEPKPIAQDAKVEPKPIEQDGKIEPKPNEPPIEEPQVSPAETDKTLERTD